MNFHCKLISEPWHTPSPYNKIKQINQNIFSYSRAQFFYHPIVYPYIHCVYINTNITESWTNLVLIINGGTTKMTRWRWEQNYEFIQRGAIFSMHFFVYVCICYVRTYVYWYSNFTRLKESWVYLFGVRIALHIEFFWSLKGPSRIKTYNSLIYRRKS